MRGIYYAKFLCASRTSSGTLMSLEAPATATVEIIAAEVTNTNNDVPEQYRVQLIRGFTAQNGTSVTPSKMDVGDQAAAAVVIADYVSEPAYTTAPTVTDAGFNNLSGWLYLPKPKDRALIPPGGVLAVRFPEALNVAAILEVSMTWKEIG